MDIGENVGKKIVVSMCSYLCFLRCCSVIFLLYLTWTSYVVFRNPPKAQTCRQPCSCLWELFSMRMWMFGFMRLPAWRKHCIETRYRKPPSVELKINRISIWTKSLKLLIVTGCSLVLGYSPQSIKLFLHKMGKMDSFSWHLCVGGLSNPSNLCDADSARLVYFFFFPALRKGVSKNSISTICFVGLLSSTCMAFASGV